MPNRSRVPGKAPIPSRGEGLARFRRVGLLRDLGAVLSAIALLIQIGLPLVHRPTAAAGAPASADIRTAAFFGSNLALCLSGAKERPGSPTQAPGHKPLLCPACLALHGLDSFVAPSAILVVASPWLAAPASFIARAPIVVPFFALTSQPRAPPVMA